MTLIYTIDIVLFIIFAINILYLTVYSIASLLHNPTPPRSSTKAKRIAILIPAYKEDAVIQECVESCIAQEYPCELYDTVVISDRMSELTNQTLEQLPVKLVRVHFESSTKSKALNLAMDQIGDEYDLALVLDADNVIQPHFLSQLNDMFADPKVEIAQAHRCAKNTNTPLALLDAVSEEINNSIFRKGHARLGMSAALIGSGMCFRYNLFKSTMLSINAIGGFDRALEIVLLREGKHFEYMPYSDVLDEKVHQGGDFSNQRRRWLSAQLHYMMDSFKYIPSAIANRQWDLCDKLFQQMSIPRVMLLGFSAIISLIMTLIDSTMAIKWWALLALLIMVLVIAIPRRLMRKELVMAILQLPYFFALMALNIFKLRGANKKFIHTKHGVK